MPTLLCHTSRPVIPKRITGRLVPSKQAKATWRQVFLNSNTGTSVAMSFQTKTGPRIVSEVCTECRLLRQRNCDKFSKRLGTWAVPKANGGRTKYWFCFLFLFTALCMKYKYITGKWKLCLPLFFKSTLTLVLVPKAFWFKWLRYKQKNGIS